MTNSYHKIKKQTNEKAILVTTWHSAQKHWSQIPREKYHQHIENDIYLKKVFPKKPIITFCKKKSISIYIFRNDINEANKQKKPRITAPFSLCRKTYHLINSDQILENISYAAKFKIHGDIYIGNTWEELRVRFNKHRYNVKNRPDNNTLADHIHKYQLDLDKGKRIMGRQIHLFIGHKSTCGASCRTKTIRTRALWRFYQPYCMKYITFTYSPGEEIINARSISSAFSENFRPGKLGEISAFYAVPLPQYKILLIIIVQQVLKHWNISFKFHCQQGCKFCHISRGLF